MRGNAPRKPAPICRTTRHTKYRVRSARAESARKRTRRAPSGLLAALRVDSLPPICRAPWKGRGDIRRAAVRGLGTFTWGFLRHSPASVLARGKNRRDARRVSVEKPWESPWESRGKFAIGVLPGDLPLDMVAWRKRIWYNITHHR